MSALATSSVARIAHAKLAVLHVAKAADASVKVFAGSENVSFVAKPTR
jgi:hypothetical protein